MSHSAGLYATKDYIDDMLVIMKSNNYKLPFSNVTETVSWLLKFGTMFILRQFR